MPHYLSIGIFLDFNSIKVRLEPLSFAENGASSSFQFHKGTIRTRGSLQGAGGSGYFNSIKVRLEQGVSTKQMLFIAISIP